MGVMELVAFVEASFGVKVDDHDITPDNFDSVRKLADYVRRISGAVAGLDKSPVEQSCDK